MKRSPDAGSMLGQRRRRWPNIDPALGDRFVFAGICTWSNLVILGALLRLVFNIYLCQTSYVHNNRYRKPQNFNEVYSFAKLFKLWNLEKNVVKPWLVII